MPASTSERLLVAAAAAIAAGSWLAYRFLRQPQSEKAATQIPPAATSSELSQSAPAGPAIPTPSAEQAPPFEIGTTVVLQELLSKPELNGKRGRIIGWSAAKGRLNVFLRSGKMLQVKPANLLDAEMAPQRVEEMLSEDLMDITLKGGAFSETHAERVLELLRCIDSPVTAGQLLRCCCYIDWFVPAIQNVASSAWSVEPIEHPVVGPGLLLHPSAERCKRMASTMSPPSGSQRVAVQVSGRGGLFTPASLEGLKFVSFRTLPLTDNDMAPSDLRLLIEGHFPSLYHMSSALRLEASLGSIRASLSSPTSTASAELAPQIKEIATHIFFCFSASTDENSVLPITSMHEGGSYMLLYTCEMVLETARRVMTDLGAFRAAGNSLITARPLPLESALNALTSVSGNQNAGVHINEFVPGMHQSGKITSLKTAEIAQIFEAHKQDHGQVV